MPKYKLKQYGLKQYGIYQDSTDPGGGGISSIHFKFVRARIGARLKSGQMIWAYQHRPVHISGQVSTLKLSNNLGESIFLREAKLKGNLKKVRLSAPGQEFLESQQLYIEGKE